ncbi:N-acetyltransferase family protein [Brevibacillus ginsengisoli]|uniref:GNAT family N-acetyltransferase n=1 Tax=Brevibacillus ginsengisoli TaxID=363854 RepID=UPI003CEADD57
MLIRNLREADFQAVTSVLNDWWGGRQMAHLLPRLFFVHFSNTSFVIEENGQLIGFLCGFISQSHPREAYIHFVGVHPAHREKKLGRQLYEKFFSTVSQSGCDTVRCITSPVNKGSIAFHTQMGFDKEAGDQMVDGVSFASDYDGKSNDRVLFVKKL